MFEGITLNDIKKARQHAAKATPPAPVEPGKFCWKRLTDAQINHFLDFFTVWWCYARCGKWYKNCQAFNWSKSKNTKCC